MVVAALTAVAVAGAVAIGVGPAHAALYCGQDETLPNVNIFVGSGNNLWSNPISWSKNHIPGGGEEVCVPGGKIAVVSSASNSLLGATGGLVTTLRVEGTIRIEGGNTVSLASAIYGGSNLFNGGVIQVYNGSTFDLNADQNGAPAFQNVVGGSLIQVSSGSKILLRRPFLNTGTIDLTGGGAMYLDSAASEYSTGGTSGALVGGQLQLTAGWVTYGGSGALSVLASASGGGVRGTIGANQSLDVRCVGGSYAYINWTQNLVNNGTIRFLPPTTGACESDYTLPGGSTLTNNGSLTIGTPGVASNGTGVGVSSNFYQRDGRITNGPNGTITVNDYWSALEQIDNQGTITVNPSGFLQQPYNKLLNTGTFVNGGRCDLQELDSSGGTVELKTSCGIRTKATFTSTSTLRPHSSATDLAKLTVVQSSPLGGTVNVVTDGTPPANGTVRDLVTGPVSGTFAGVTSQSGAVGYTAIYKPSNAGVQLQSGPGTGTDAITAIVPARLLDTRPDGTTTDGVGAAAGVQSAGSTIEVQVTGRADVPANATAAVLNVTVTEAQGPGFVTVWPCGSAKPTASSLNFVTGSTVPNGVISKIGTGGKVCVFVSNSTQVLADVGGYFTDASPYKPIVPARLLDTRQGEVTVDGAGQGGGPVAAGSVTEVQVTGRAGVPTGAAAAVFNVTVTAASAPGFITVFPCGSPRPTASSLNFVTGSTVPNNVIAKIGDGGKVCLFASNGTQLLADINGYFGVSSSFSAISPQRLLDTRQGEATADGVGAGGGPSAAGTVTEVQITGRVGVPAGAAAAVLNVTVTEAQGSGFVTVFPCGSQRPTASSLNFVTGSTVPNGVIAKIGAGGKICVFASNGTHLITDVNGYFSG